MTYLTGLKNKKEFHIDIEITTEMNKVGTSMQFKDTKANNQGYVTRSPPLWDVN